MSTINPIIPLQLEVDDRPNYDRQKTWEFCSSGGITVSIDLAVTLSWAVNWFLLIAKLYIAIVSSSKAVWASLADSAVDLLSQVNMIELPYKLCQEHYNEIFSCE